MIELIINGGPVMIPLLLCSVIAVAVALERAWFLLRNKTDTEDLIEDVKLSLGQGKVLEAMQMTKKARGPVASVLASGIAYYDRPTENIKAHMEDVGKEEVYKMEKRMNILSMIVTVAPLLGLLGTVTGIMEAFNVMDAMQGIASPADLSGGIAEALITTAAGLIIAIPTMVVYSSLDNIIDRNIAEMSKRSTELLRAFDARGDI